MRGFDIGVFSRKKKYRRTGFDATLLVLATGRACCRNTAARATLPAEFR